MHFGAVILAAGGAKRMGRTKQLLPFQGKTLVENAIIQAELAGFLPVVVVLGAQAEAVGQAVARTSARPVLNEDWESGMGSSIKTGVEKLLSLAPDLEGLAILLADQPFILADHLKEMSRIFSLDGAPVLAARYAGTCGVPAFFRSSTFSRLLELTPEAGARSLLRAGVTEVLPFDLPEAANDIDTPADFANLRELKGKNALITGASRGIGAATAVKFAELGAGIVLNYRSKAARAQDVLAKLQILGVKAIPAQADITNPEETAEMFSATHRQLGQLDYLILNASGGMEKDRPEDYAMLLNRDSQILLAKQAMSLMPPGSRIVFVTSHWAHFYGSKPVMPDYESVAKSKRAGEDALRTYAAEFTEKGISLVVVSGDLIEGTITPKLLQRQSPGLIELRRQEAGGLPTIDDFATAIVNAAIDRTLPTGHTVYVGSTDY